MQHLFNHNIDTKHLKYLRQTKKTLNVCITGGTRGLGKALAREFLKHGDKVIINSRNKDNLQKVKDELSSNNLYGYICDVGNKDDIEYFTNTVVESHKDIDIWINNAGSSGGYRTFEELDYDTIDKIVSTNFLGTVLSTKQALNTMSNQDTGGAIYNMAGAGSSGMATPYFSVYGGTKCGISQFTKSIQTEMKRNKVDVHVLSPGMMLTDLLMDNLNPDIFDKIKCMCSNPDLVAFHLVPRIRRAYYYADHDSYVNYLTWMKILFKVVKQPFTKTV
jgi:chlorophyll(ide) b reductase